MKNKDSFQIDDKVLKSLDARTLTIIRHKGPQMEAEIAAKKQELQNFIHDGFSSNKVVTAIVNGCHQVIEISIDPEFSDRERDQTKTCALIAEAINDAIYKIDLVMATEISTIQYKYLGDVIKGDTKLWS